MYKRNFPLSILFKLPDEVCVIRRNQSKKIKQVDKICCCVLLTSTYLKNYLKNDTHQPPLYEIMKI